MPQSIGTLETSVPAGAIKAAGAILKASSIRIHSFSLVGSGLVAVVECGRAEAEKLSQVISRNVIPNPDGEVKKLME